MPNAQVEETKEKDSPEPKEKKVLTLEDITQLGYLRKTKEVFEGVTVSLQTLSHARQQQTLLLLPAGNIDQLAKYTQMQVETLSHATVDINGREFTEKDVDFLRGWYSKLQNKVLIEIYNFYLELVDEQDGVLDGLKKK